MTQVDRFGEIKILIVLALIAIVILLHAIDVRNGLSEIKTLCMEAPGEMQ